MKKSSPAQHFLTLLFPFHCVVCGQRQPVLSCCAICSRCLGEVRFIRRPVCRICGVEVHGEKCRDYLCGACLQKTPPFVIARSLVRYGPVVQQLVHRLKYRADTSVVTALIEVVSCCDLSFFADCDLIIPVPLHRRRLQQRGLNQALVMGRVFFPERRASLRHDGLRRTVNTRSQTRLSGEERRKNLQDVFRVNSRMSVTYKTVCLVDDVFTTGATASECSKALLHRGAKEVRVLTFARVEVSPHNRKSYLD